MHSSKETYERKKNSFWLKRHLIWSHAKTLLYCQYDVQMKVFKNPVVCFFSLCVCLGVFVCVCVCVFFLFCFFFVIVFSFFFIYIIYGVLT